ncbi:hypothetical protein Val02_31090 [Virgisporangium aliadipatigenens]|uniref:Uncharacterized protein n=2 Tax=Virgisporangium aliadipatigenens TaxID=741659 RepID=A0A8J3YM12_9ACTN|nr:hypothetical protein Val02_31090 [Virgisporangium aliadipatigenens]
MPESSQAARAAVDGLRTEFKNLLHERLPGGPVQAQLDARSADEPWVWADRLAAGLAECGADRDEGILFAARRLLALTDPAGTQAGKYAITFEDGTGVQVGDRNLQHNVNAAPDSTVAVGGRDAYSVTGDRNRINSPEDKRKYLGLGFFPSFVNAHPLISSVVVVVGVVVAVTVFTQSSHGSDDSDRSPRSGAAVPSGSGRGSASVVPGQGPSSPGNLAGKVEIAPRTVNLTADGTEDWVHWGYLASDGGGAEFIGHPARQDCPRDGRCVIRRQGGTALIGALTPTGSFDQSKLPFRLYVRDAWSTFAWTDGTNPRAVEGARTVLYNAGAGNGFRIQVPADQTGRRLRLYIGNWNGAIRTTAALSDDQGTPYVDTSPRASSYHWMYTFDYRASKPGQSLTVTIAITDDFGGANTAISAATLQRTG